MSKRILIADDSNSVRQMVRLTLEEAGYTVEAAEDGQDAVNRLSGQIDMVITDLHMPNLNGIGVIQAVRQHPDYKFVPVIVLTTESEATKKQEAKEVGATGWIIKPFDPQRLIAVTKKVLG